MAVLRVCAGGGPGSGSEENLNKTLKFPLKKLSPLIKRRSNHNYWKAAFVWSRAGIGGAIKKLTPKECKKIFKFSICITLLDTGINYKLYLP